jgi:cystathionine beta-lyase family protein involved in aluminum resistance
MIGDTADVITQRELKLIFDMSGPGTIDIGTLQQDSSIHAYISVDDMVRKHFAVFGATEALSSALIGLVRPGDEVA